MWLIVSDRKSKDVTAIDISKFDHIQVSRVDVIGGTSKAILQFTKLTPGNGSNVSYIHDIDIITVEQIEQKFKELFDYVKKYGFRKDREFGVIEAVNDAYYDRDDRDKVINEFCDMLSTKIIDGAENAIVGKMFGRFNKYCREDVVAYTHLCSILFDVNLEFMWNYLSENYRYGGE